MPCSAAPNQREWDARECTWNAVRTRPARIPALLCTGDDVRSPSPSAWTCGTADGRRVVRRPRATVSVTALVSESSVGDGVSTGRLPETSVIAFRGGRG